MQDLNAADESWEILQQFLPDNLEESAREHGAFQRARGEIRSAAVLLRLCCCMWRVGCRWNRRWCGPGSTSW
jgi:hypothetical protein